MTSIEAIAKALHGVIEIAKRVETKVDRILTTLESQGRMIMSNLDTLTAAVQAEVTVEQSAITLLNGLKSQLDAAGTDPAKLQALSAQIGSSSSALAAAITANTPAAAAGGTPAIPPPAP